MVMLVGMGIIRVIYYLLEMYNIVKDIIYFL